MELIIIGYVLDLIFGDPYWIPHPIIFIGKGISKFEGLLRKIFKEDESLRLGGIVLAVGIVISTYFITFSLLAFIKTLNFGLSKAVEAFMIFQILATKSLAKESIKVYYPLKERNLSDARKLLSYIVGRDTTNLEQNEITRATVETIAENISDGIIAPLLYTFIGGAPLGMAYKAINTLDSMVGYKNDKYRYFGWASAKIDDVANFIPARLTGVLIIAASLFLGYDTKNSLKIFLRDRKNHSSPNAGYPEAAVAGALNIQLGGTNIYFGKPVFKPTIGDKLRNIEIEDIKKTISIMYMTSFLGVCLLGIIKFVI
ncbi:adenosylcobinamide-phosphate synthase CbiB [Paramaledivibacter caminithermalis]|jgi:adenosylcobinamide-phosphate synthase|uniref:Cobalamin biosynthesis protein CobD n=1 Tax=Paramaledivibacter caminithermalis (strain DSM 15212 / CIP 107654 / DViRD3) TaxID=1121301 RepID=A0A1M6MLS5_PARC5|nr:adenosylcobinamide-phosphate synthase CbiB [Paramaledivibacter caminithermalis]SHJ84374.1 adenosylcobinamide-phosphate synthase [Paramaledivibacter caminithermalis DSM 15212]